MLALVASVWVASLVGSAHCAAMCGGFVCAYAGGARGRTDWAAHVAYNVGRLVSYLALGTIAGLAGASLTRAGAIAGVARPAAIVAGVLMVLWGSAAALRAGGVRLPALPLTGRAPAALRGALVRVAQQPAPVRAATLGLLTTLLPCGWLWAFAIT
ncbi:MAG: sulfite exporter TauE/SafE family protein, partial [Gemmatimonadaceae bacterium]|nr:sulfite exporter TauE/SafE family protein [Gemmatimonadaceae bacterium]